MGISVVYCFHQNNHVASRLFFAKKLPRLLKGAAGRGRLPSSRQQVARVEHEMPFGGFACPSRLT
jgi:hypothetical protein